MQNLSATCHFGTSMRDDSLETRYQSRSSCQYIVLFLFLSSLKMSARGWSVGQENNWGLLQESTRWWVCPSSQHTQEAVTSGRSWRYPNEDDWRVETWLRTWPGCGLLFSEHSQCGRQLCLSDCSLLVLPLNLLCSKHGSLQRLPLSPRFLAQYHYSALSRSFDLGMLITLAPRCSLLTFQCQLPGFQLRQLYSDHCNYPGLHTHSNDFILQNSFAHLILFIYYYQW